MFLYYWMLRESEAKRGNEPGSSIFGNYRKGHVPKSVDSSWAILDSIFTIPSSSKYVFRKRSGGVKMETWSKEWCVYLPLLSSMSFLSWLMFRTLRLPPDRKAFIVYQLRRYVVFKFALLKRSHGSQLCPRKNIQ